MFTDIFVCFVWVIVLVNFTVGENAHRILAIQRVTYSQKHSQGKPQPNVKRETQKALHLPVVGYSNPEFAFVFN